MDNINLVISLIIGISLMLFGMNLMSNSISLLADSKLELYLYKLTENRPKAVFFGFLSTAIVQSSAAVSSLTISFADNSFIKLKQASEIILGAILGTSATGFIIALSSLGTNNSISKYFSAKTIIAAFSLAGIIFKLIIKNNKYNKIGDVMLGFAIIMFSISTISSESAQLKESQFIESILTNSSNEIIAIISGFIISALFQSASAAVGLIQSLSIAGIISFNFSFLYLAGVMIGSSLPVILFAVGKSKKAKIGASVYLVFNLIGSISVLLIFLLIKNRSESLILNSFQISLLNFIIRLVSLIIIYPFCDTIQKRISRFSIKNKSLKREQL